MFAQGFVLLGCLALPALQVAELDATVPAKVLDEARRPASNARLSAAELVEMPRIPKSQFGPPLRESRFALAIEKAARKGIVERSVEGYSEVLIQCQNEKSTVLTTPFMRSDSQQAHCYRF